MFLENGNTEIMKSFKINLNGGVVRVVKRFKYLKFVIKKYGSFEEDKCRIMYIYTNEVYEVKRGIMCFVRYKNNNQGKR